MEVSGPVGVNRMTIGSPNQLNAASTSRDSEGTKNESASLQCSFHVDQLLAEGQSALGIEVSRTTRDPCCVPLTKEYERTVSTDKTPARPLVVL